MISMFEDLFPLTQPDLPSIPTPLLLQHLRQAARIFCEETEAWREKLEFYIVDAPAAGDTAYDAAIAAGQSTAAADEAYDIAYEAALVYNVFPKYDADVTRIWKVWDTGDEDDEPLDPTLYEFDVSNHQLRFKSQLTTYSPTATTWATSTAYTAGDYVIVSSKRYLCAITHTSGTWATDLAAGKWKVMHNDLIVREVLIPRLFTAELAAWFMEKWSGAIVAKTMADLCAMRNKAWSSPDRVPYFLGEYNRLKAKAIREKWIENKRDSLTFETMPFVR